MNGRSRSFFKIFGWTAVFALFAAILFVPHYSFAQVQISASIPGSYDTSGAGAPPSAFIANFYQYALSIAGIIAFGIIVYGGVRYMVSVGNPSGESDAKEWIKAAIMGLLLLAGAYLILNIVNPNLVNLTLPSLQPSGAQNTTSTATIWSPTSPPQHTGQTDCTAHCYLPSTCTQDAPNSNYWSCVAPKNAPTSTTNGVACPPGSKTLCTPPKLCSGYPTLTGVLYSCAVPPQTPTGTVYCKGSNVACSPPNTCQTNNDIAPGWQTCEAPL